MEKEKIIQFIIKRRKELGYSQNYIASELGISDQAVSNWERGISFPDITYLDEIAKILDTNVESIVNAKQSNIKLQENVSFDIERFRTYLISLRKAGKLTQNQLGSALEISGQNISKYENGAFLPSIEVLEKYAKYFNLNFLNVYYGLDDEDLYIKEEKKTRTINKKKIAMFTSLFASFIVGVIMCVLFFGGFFEKMHIVTVVIGDEIKNYEVRDKEEFVLPSLPTKKGYEVSWDDSNNLITEDKTFTAIYTPKVYKITYDFLDEDIEEYVQEVKYGEEFELYIPDYEYFESYTYQDKVFESGVYNYDYDIVLKANFNNYRNVTIVIDKNNIITYSVKIGTNITLPEIPNKIGHDSMWNNTDTLINEDKTYFVIYSPKQYKIKYVYENDILETREENVTYGEQYNLYIPRLNNYSFLGYIYNGNAIENDIYLFDHDITVYGRFSNEVYNVHYGFYNVEDVKQAGYGSSYIIEDYDFQSYLSYAEYNKEEHDKYDIVAWRSSKGDVYQVGESIIYNFKEDTYLWAIFEYSGDSFEFEIVNGEARITKCNMDFLYSLIIPDYIVSNGNRYKVVELAPGSFQDVGFVYLSLSSNISKISRYTFHYNDSDIEEVKTLYSSNFFLLYNGTLKDWLNIEFEEFIVCNKKETVYILQFNSFLINSYHGYHKVLEIPEGVEVIKKYTFFRLYLDEVIIPDSVHTIEEGAFVGTDPSVIKNLENVENVHDNAFE